MKNERPIMTLNEWGFISQDIFMGIGKLATPIRPKVFKFKLRRSYV